MRFRLLELLPNGRARPLHLHTPQCRTARRLAAKRRAAYEPNPGERAMLRALHGASCAYCGREARELTLDHLTPLCRGGTTTLENAMLSCAPCNNKKSGQTAAEFGRPDVTERAMAVAHAVDEFWRGYPTGVPATWRGILGRMVNSRLFGARRLR